MDPERSPGRSSGFGHPVRSPGHLLVHPEEEHQSRPLIWRCWSWSGYPFPSAHPPPFGSDATPWLSWVNRAAIAENKPGFTDCFTYSEFELWIKDVTLNFEYAATINWHQIVADAYVRKSRALWFIQDNGVPFALAFWCGPQPSS